MKNTVEYREKHNLKQFELADRAGISKQLLCWHERNPDKRWTYHNAVKIDRATDGQVRWIDLVR